MTQSAAVLALDVLVPPLAPAVLLLFLGAGFTIFSTSIAAAVAAVAGRHGLSRFLAACALMVAVGYGVLLLAASLVSRERTLEAGDKKYFCEMDCHLAYSVEAAGVDAGGPAVTVRTWFDPETIARFRGNRPLTPNPRVLYLVDDRGRRYWPTEGGVLTRPLRPGESYTTRFTFDVPAGARGLRLFLGDSPGLENLIVNHENSPFHAKVYFALPPPLAAERS